MSFDEGATIMMPVSLRLLRLTLGSALVDEALRALEHAAQDEGLQDYVRDAVKKEPERFIATYLHWQFTRMLGHHVVEDALERMAA